jgi:HEAT repeat protein
MGEVGRASLEALVEALDDRQAPVPSEAALALVRFGPRALPAVAPLLDAYQQSVRAQAVWIARTIAADQMAGGSQVGWPAVLQALLAVYDDTISRAERTRLTRAVVSMLDEHEIEL